ncbi:hypothetical protein ACQBAU_05510 [Propionibacteriaceae bacterium Y2011]
MATQPVPPALAGRHRVPADEFWRDWTAAEVAAKLADVPILTWLGRHRLGTATGVETVLVDDLVVSAGTSGGTTG